MLGSVVVGCFSCLQPHAIRMADTDPRGWNAHQPVTVSYQNTDTVSMRDLWAVVRFCNDFAYDRLELSVTTVSPDGYRWCDTLSLEVQGHLPHVGLYGEREQLYRRRVVLPHAGRYLFELTPVMPDTLTRGVAAVGVRLADASPETTNSSEKQTSPVTSADSIAFMP